MCRIIDNTKPLKSKYYNRIVIITLIIAAYLKSYANDTIQLINAIQYFNSQTTNLCCSDSNTIVNAITLVRNQFEVVINNYPNSYLKDDAQYFIGKIYQYGYTPQNQIIEWQKIIDLYPGQFFSTITTGSSWYSNYPNPGLSYVPSDAWAMQQVAGSLLNPISDTLAFQMIDTIVAHFPDICQSAEALLMKGDYYNGLAERYLAVEAYEEVLDLFPQCLATCGYAYDRIGAMMAAIGDWAVIDTFRQRLEEDYCINNHLSEGNFAVLQNKRWNKPMPFVLSLYANASNAIDSMLVDSVISIYETNFPNLVSFNWVADQSQGGNPYNGVDIEIEFWPYGINYAQIGGFGNYPLTEIYRSIIHVSNTATFTARLKTLIHEMGHSLGLGHSFNNEDIMFFSTSQVADSTLSARDIATLQQLYSPYSIDTIYRYENDTIYLYDGSKHFLHGTYNTSIFNKQICDTMKFTCLNILQGIQGKKYICLGADTILNYSVTNLPGANSYVWTMPNGFIGSSTTNSISLIVSNQAISGTLAVKAITNNDTLENTLYLEVSQKPQTPTISQTNSNTLISSAQFGNQWYNMSGSILNANDSSYIMNYSGEYYVQVDSNHCLSDTSIHVFYQRPCSIYVWQGGIDNGNWLNEENWTGSISPEACDTIVIPNNSQPAIINYGNFVSHRQIRNYGNFTINGFLTLNTTDSITLINDSSAILLCNGALFTYGSKIGIVNQNNSTITNNQYFSINPIETGIVNKNNSTILENINSYTIIFTPSINGIVNQESTINNNGYINIYGPFCEVGLINNDANFITGLNSTTEIFGPNSFGIVNENSAEIFHNGYLSIRLCDIIDIKNQTGSNIHQNGIIDILKQ